jgi:thymidine kinase
MITHLTPEETLVKCDRVSPCELSFFETIGIKHRLPVQFLWQKHGRPVGVSCLRTAFFENNFSAQKDILNIARYLKLLVIIHGRDNIINCLCIVCTKKFEILTIYSMYRFCSDECYENYRKLPTDKQRELSS